MAMAWREGDAAAALDPESCAAGRLWQNACAVLCAPRGEDAWRQIVEASPSDDIWHSLKNCVAYQAEVWQNLLTSGISDVMQPAAFKMAIVLRHTPSDIVVKILGEMLKSHPQCQDLTSYILALLTEDEAAGCAGSPASSPAATPSGPAPARDLRLYADCELAVLAAAPAPYARHAALVRNEYPRYEPKPYADLRTKILNQFCMIPKLFNTPEFEGMERAARENIKRELQSLKDQH